MEATYEGWASDPFDAHEVRYFVDGRPTKLIRDGSVEEFDPLPPLSTWPASLRSPRLAEPVVLEPVEPVEAAEPVVLEPVEPVEAAEPVVLEPVESVEPVEAAEPIMLEPVESAEPVEAVESAEPIMLEPVESAEPGEAAMLEPVESGESVMQEPVESAEPVEPMMPPPLGTAYWAPPPAPGVVIDQAPEVPGADATTPVQAPDLGAELDDTFVSRTRSASPRRWRRRGKSSSASASVSSTTATPAN